MPTCASWIFAFYYKNRSENKKDPTYSPLSLYFIIDNNLIKDKEKVNELFDEVINKTPLKNEIKNILSLNIPAIAIFPKISNKLKRLLNGAFFYCSKERARWALSPNKIIKLNYSGSTTLSIA